jgi:hypothetical protein
MAMLPWVQLTFLREACAGAATVSPNSRILRKPILYFPAEGDSVLVAHFLDNVRDDVHTAADSVMLSTKQQKLRWHLIVLQTHREYMATILQAERQYYSCLARVFVRSAYLNGIWCTISYCQRSVLLF